jgi:hypothetical protein
LNLFYLDDDLDLCAEYHIDKHVGKMQLEATQLLSTALWVDRYIGFVPRALTPEEWAVINEAKRAEPPIDERTFTRYLPCHQNHPSAIWVRSSLEHYYWTINYVNALEIERLGRGYKKPHDSCKECNRLPEPTRLRDEGFVRPFQAMPPELKSDDVVQDYRLFYMLDKGPFAKWTARGKPSWWDESIARYDRRYTDLNEAERRETGWL